MDMKRFFLYFITIAALALAGCGGGGGGTPGSSLQDQLDASDMEVTRLMGALMNAQDEATRLQGLIDASPTKTELQDRLVMANQTITNLQAQIDMLMPPGEVPNPTSNAITGGIVAPSTPGDPSTARGTALATRPGQSSDDTDDFEVTPGVIGTAGTTSIGIDNLDVVAMTEDEPTPGQFMPQAGSETPLGDFAGSMYERTVMDGDRTDTITVYTNLGNPTGQAYTEYYSQDNAASRDAVTGADSDGVLNINEEDVEGNSALFYGSGFPNGANRHENVPADDEMTMDVEENTFMGMFHDIPGTYECVGVDCRATNDGDGYLAELAGEWTFTPAELETGDDPHMVQGVVHDSDYLSFGYWVQATTDEDDMMSYGVGTFYDGATDFAGQLANLKGSATYSGNAAGMYARKTLNPDGKVVTLTTGDFTADANLTATFGQTMDMDIAPKDLNKIDGSVTNLRDGGALLVGWTVELNAVDLNQTALTDGFSGTTTGKGNWRGQFFGPSAEDAMPSGVAGDFTGHFSNGHVIGAFGAEKD